MRKTLPVAVTALVLFASFIAAQSVDEKLEIERRRLLTAYGQYKGYSDTSPQAVEKGLKPDRRAVFDACIRALFTMIEPKSGPAQKRLIDFVDTVKGIWGFRLNNDQGRHQFRLSVTWRQGLAQALNGSRNFPSAVGGHVLMPVNRGGDDDEAFTKFDVKRNTPTHRHARPEPKLQISYLESDPTIGEVDVDFHGGLGCHLTPSNSDVGSRDGRSAHEHLKDFNDPSAYGLFSKPLQLHCQDRRGHCEDSYRNPYCS
jgi:hypothetical protein